MQYACSVFVCVCVRSSARRVHKQAEMTEPLKLKKGFYEADVESAEWLIPERYQDLKPLGVGTFGTVYKAMDTELQRPVAMKKLSQPFQGNIHAMRCYRELKLLTHLNHENVIPLYNVFTPSEDFENFKDVYLVMELMTTDLQKAMHSEKLAANTIDFFTYQLLRGLKYIHSAGVIHRDIKASNIGVSVESDLRILDFGLARAKADLMTGYVTTRHCRAPEIMLNWMHYTQKADMWSVGCVLAEMLTGQILFPGKDYSVHITKIVEFLGTPTPEVMETITNESARKYIDSLPYYEKKDFSKFFLGANPKAIDLLSQLIQMDPDKRPSAAEALKHPYLVNYHDPEDEPVCDRQYDDSFESMERDTEEWRKLVYEELMNFKPPTSLSP